jgi:hypothetical protein
MKTTVLLFTLFFVSNLLACPYCAGSSQGGKDNNTTLVLVLFIAAIYIPYFVIYRLIKKQKAFKEVHDSTGPTIP